MEFKDQTELYFQRMDSAVEQKAEILSWIKPGAVAELGAGSGALAELIFELPAVTELLALDASSEAIDHLAEHLSGHPGVSFRESVLGEDPDPFRGERFSTIVASSVFHEVYSFIGQEGLELIGAQIFDALLPGGLFILRDGVKPPHSEGPARMMLAPRLLELASRYCSEGRDGLRPELRDTVAYGTRHQISEMAFTITWGRESFSREVEEQYELYDLDGAVAFYGDLGLKCIHRATSIQSGYLEHLADSPMEIRSEGAWMPWFPPTNALWVFERPAVD